MKNPLGFKRFLKQKVLKVELKKCWQKIFRHVYCIQDINKSKRADRKTVPYQLLSLFIFIVFRI